MQPRRIVILGRLESGGTDPNTLRPLPDQLVDLRRVTGKFESVGLQNQLVANVALRLYKEKIAIRRNFLSEHDYFYSTNNLGKKTLFRLITTQNYVENGVTNPNLIWLIVTEDKTQNIIDAFKEALKDENIS